ncbi:MAG: beta-ketoacyl-[acyl-carrier-protein] synthase family protein [Pseudomonadota bacterium]
MPERKRVVVSGFGVVCPIGNSSGEVFKSWKTCKSGIQEIRLFGERSQRISFAAPVRNFDAGLHFSNAENLTMGRSSQYARVAAREALREAERFFEHYNKENVSCYMGVSTGDVQAVEDGYIALLEKQRRLVSPTTIPVAMINAAVAQISMEHQIRGKNLTFASACASSTQAIGEGYLAIANGEIKAVIAGGTDACLSWGNWVGWESLNVMDPKGCRPFTRDRNGMTLGEGAGIVILEERESAVQRGASISAEVLGYFSNTDGVHVTQPNQQSIQNVMLGALADAQLHPNQVDFVNAHATGTKQIDIIETNAIKQVFCDRVPPPVSAQKSLIGHLMGAAGVVESIIAIQNLQSGFLAPTSIKGELDDDCDLDYIPNVKRKMSARICLKNSFGFGGVNASLVIGRHDEVTQ